MATTTTLEDNQFGSEFLQDIMDYIAHEFAIDELYSRSEIAAWLEDNAGEYGYTLEE